jgi:tetratricopeptide (TPR) repeat protein
MSRQMTPRQQLESGRSHHQAGRLTEAEKIYRQVLARNPNHPDALQLLGALAGQAGRLDEAIDLISRAIAINPDQVIYHCNLSEMYRRAGKPQEAISAARRAIRLNPSFAKAYCNMGLALTLAGTNDEAVAAFRRAIELNPDFIDAYLHLGNTLNSLDQHEDAIVVFRRLCKLKPDSAEALRGLGTALRDSGKPREAIPVLRQALEIQPESSPTHNILGVALGLTDQVDEAIAAFRRALQIQPDNALAMKNLGVALAEKGQFDDAIAALDQAVQLKPDLPEAHGNLALLLLMKGDFDRGWPEYEWRSRVQLTLFVPPRDFAQPRWDGGSLQGKTILLHAEQGFGDTIQFVRYLPMVARRGGRVILDCPKELVRLLRKAPGVDSIIATGDAQPRFDCHCPLLSLPLAFSTDLNAIPAEIPYLSPDLAAVAQWKSRIESTATAFKVGLVWAGSAKNKLDRKRSIAFDQLFKLAAPGIHFFSLQKGREVQSPPPEMAFTDWTAELHDFDDTAALIANLDLVISVDTAVAHLAGAMGKPVWMMIPLVPDWRWLLNRTDSPWYPTMRIFRQESVGDWAGVVQNVADALQKARSH